MKPTKEQTKETGIVIGLVILYIGIVTGSFMWFKISFLIILLTLLIPSIFYFPAKVWFGFSEKLGSVVSRIVLAIIYFIVVMPVGLLRKVLKKDSMMLKSFNKGLPSSWVVREHKYSEKDILKPY